MYGPPVIYERINQDNNLALSLSNVLELYVLNKLAEKLNIEPCKLLDSSICTCCHDVPACSQNINNCHHSYLAPYISVDNCVDNINSYNYIQGPYNFDPCDIWNIDTHLPCSCFEGIPTCSNYYDHNLIFTNLYDNCNEIPNPYNPICTYCGPNVNMYPITYENIDLCPNTYVNSYTNEFTDCVNTNLPVGYEIVEIIIPTPITCDNPNVIPNVISYVSPQCVESRLPLVLAESPYNCIDINSYNIPQSCSVLSSVPVSSQFPASPCVESNVLPLCLKMLMPSPIPSELCVSDIPISLGGLTITVDPLYDCIQWEYV